MLNAGEEVTERSTSGVRTGADPGEPDGAVRQRDSATRRLRLFAVILGLLGTVLSLSVPFLPEHYDITTLKWPTAQGTQAVSAPLVSYSPLWLDAKVPCAAAQSLDARSTNGPGTLLSTNPPNSDNGKLTGLILQVQHGQVTMLIKGQQVGTAALLGGGDCAINLHVDGSTTTAQVGSKPLANFHGQDRRPQLTGIFSDLNDKIDPVKGLSFQARVDDRWDSYPGTLKDIAIAGSVLAFLGSVIVLRRLDVRAGRRPPRWAPRGWWKPTWRDVAVLFTLVVWWLIGAMTSDDGYIQTIARARWDAGYITDYYRWFAVPEAPFGWFYELYSAMMRISTATPWVRLPALVMGIASWLLISREVLPRLGQQVRRSNAAGWAAAAVFLAFWLPYDNGLRPEPVVVLFSLLALCAVERAVATGRLMPAALGLVVAAFSVGANPHGLVAVLPFVAAAKPLLRLVRKRAREFGWLPVLTPIGACGFMILSVVFYNQTWKSISDATALRTELGPAEHWYQELDRYNLLFSQSADGSMARRFPVLLVILCLVTCAVVLLRRGRINGAALGPSRRLLAVTALSFLVLTLTPTKWSHHFGMFAAVGGALAALTALATSSTVLRSKRNRAGFFAGLMLICAFSATGPNAFWYVSGWGVPWFDKPPSLYGHNLATYLLGIAFIAVVVAFIEHLRLDEHNPGPPPAVEQRSRALRLGTAPLSVVCALIVLFEVGAFAKVIQKQWGSYSLGYDNVKQIAGQSCGLSDYIYVETNPLDGMLKASPGQPGAAAPGTQAPTDNGEPEDPNHYLRSKIVGFSRPGLPPGDGSAPDEPDWKPPHHFGGDNAPVWGSYSPNGVNIGELRTQWYDLPDRAASGKVPVVLSLAGAERGANALAVEFGRDTPQGFEILESRTVLQGGGPQWRDARITVDGKAEGATKMRVVAKGRSLGTQGWLAVSAPRAPQLTEMSSYVGDAPTFVEWTAAFAHPCLQVPPLRNGIAEMPKFRVAAGAEVRGGGQGWSSPEAGGPFGWLDVAASVRELPTYLRNNIHRDWGSLYEVDPYKPDALPPQAAMEVHQETHWGTWSPGPMSQATKLPEVPKSDDRNDVGAPTTSSDDQK